MANCNNDNCSNRICIQAKKVFDACLKQVTDSLVELTLDTVTPPNPTLPLTFVSGKSNTTTGVIENLNVTRIPDRPRYGRVSGDVIVPITIYYTDAASISGSGVGTLDVPFDVILRLPEPSIVPFEIEASISAVCPSGSFSTTVTQENQTEYIFIVDACIAIILKVVMNVEIIIPTYGYAVIPPCQSYNDDVCAGFFELPLFPNGNA